MTPASLIPYEYDFRNLILSLLTSFDTNEGLLEDFVAGLDFPITLRLVADKPANQRLPLRWHHQDLVDGDWASLDDLTDIDQRDYIIKHMMLVGRLQDHAQAATVSQFDAWLTKRGVPRATPYVKIKPDGTTVSDTLTLPSAVRNMIHHPENPQNVLTDAALRDSVETLLAVAEALPSPIPGLA